MNKSLVSIYLRKTWPISRREANPGGGPGTSPSIGPWTATRRDLPNSVVSSTSCDVYGYPDDCRPNLVSLQSYTGLDVIIKVSLLLYLQYTVNGISSTNRMQKERTLIQRVLFHTNNVKLHFSSTLQRKENQQTLLVIRSIGTNNQRRTFEFDRESLQGFDQNTHNKHCS